MSLLGATMLVAGNIIGTGIFLLPVTMATVGSVSIYGWVIATLGAGALGLVFAKLGELKPVLGGPYVYAKDALGPYIGFQTNAVYWLANWMGNVAIAVSTTGYLAAFIPWMGHRPGSTVGSIAVIWLLTVVNMIGPKFVGRFETWTLSLALIPILGIATVGWFWFEPSLFKEAWNVTGKSDFHAASRAASIALWAFMGIESAAVSATNIENPRRNVPIATLAGLALSAVVYVSCSTVIMGLIPNAELQKSHAPFAEAGAHIFGGVALLAVAICAVAKTAGALGGWMLVVAESSQAAAQDGMFPKIFGHVDRRGVPVRGLILVSVLMTVVVLLTLQPNLSNQFDAIVNLAVILVVLPYLYSAVALWQVCYQQKVPAKTMRAAIVIGLAAATYCLWAIYGADSDTTRGAMILVLVTVPIYPFFIRSMRAAAERKAVELASSAVAQ
jgi:arginine:agmatine antiporter